MKRKKKRKKRMIKQTKKKQKNPAMFIGYIVQVDNHLHILSLITSCQTCVQNFIDQLV